MSCDFLALAQPGVQKLSPYVPGKPVDELARELNLDPAGIVKLASNENPLGPSPRVLEAIRNELAELTRYPDGNGFVLKHTKRLPPNAVGGICLLSPTITADFARPSAPTASATSAPVRGPAARACAMPSFVAT